MFLSRKKAKAPHNPATGLFLRAPKPKPKALHKPKNIAARKLMDFYSMLICLACCFARVYGDCASLYEMQGGVWAVTTATAALHNCSLCPVDGLGLAPPVCACAPSTFLQGNTTTCEICPMHHECAGIFSPPQPCGIHRVTLVAGGSCVCADAFAPSADDRCVACPPSAWCRDGVEHVCPSHSLAAVPNASSCVCAPGAAPATRWVPWLGNVSNRVPVDVSIEFNLSLLLPSNMSQAVYVLRDASTENVWVPAQNTSIACRPCDPGTFCHGGEAEPVACGPGRTSVRGASSRAACHCLPPLTPQAGACVDPSTVMATLQVEAQDLAALAPGAIRVADALGCGLPPHGLRGVCPAVTRVVVENSTHLALFLENMIVRPAYLGLLYAFLEDAQVLRESYAVYQETWEAVIGRGHSGARCVAHVSTESLEGEDPSEVHYEAVRAAWDAAALTHADVLFQARQHTDAIVVELDFAVVLESLDSLPVESCLGITYIPERLDGTRVRLPRSPCPTLAELQCLTRNAVLAAGAPVVCSSELWWIATASSVPNFSCTEGSVAVQSFFTSNAHAGLLHLESLPATSLFRTGPFVAGQIDLQISPHVHTLSTDDFVLSGNRSRWEAQPPPDRSRQHLRGVFVGLGLPAPTLAELGTNVGVVATAQHAQELDLLITGALLPLHAIVAFVYALAARTDVVLPAVGTQWRQTFGVAVGWGDRQIFAFNNSSATLADVYVNTLANTSLRPLGAVLSARAEIAGTVDFAGSLPRVTAAVLALDPTARPLLRITGANSSTSNCTRRDFTVHTTLSADIDPALVNQFAVRMMQRFLLDPSRHAATTADLSQKNLVFTTPVESEAECSRDAVRNAAFSDEDIAAALASFATNVKVSETCAVTCMQQRQLLPESDGAAEFSHLAATGHLDLKLNGTHEDSSPILVTLHVYNDVLTPHVSAIQRATLRLPNATALALAIKALEFAPAARLLSSPLGLQAGVAGLAFLEKEQLCRSYAYATGCASRSTVGAVGSCIEFHANGSAWHADSVVQAVRRAHSVVAPIDVQEQVVTVRLVVNEGDVDAKMALLAALRPAVHVHRERGLSWRRETVRVAWPNATRAPNASDAIAVLGDEMSPLGFLQVQAHTVRATVLLRSAADSAGTTTAGILDLMRDTLEVSLRDMLGAEFVQLGQFVQHDADYDFRVALVVGAGERPCAPLGFAVHDALYEISAWSMGTFVAASVDANGMVCALDLDVESISKFSLPPRALFVECNLTSLAIDMQDGAVEVVTLNSSSLESMDRSVDIVLGAEASGVAFVVGELRHSVRVCGVLNSSIVADAFADSYGMYAEFCI